MKKRVITIIYILILLIFVFAFQLFIINSRELFGIKPNLILILVIVASAWYGEKIGGIFSFIIGLVTEMLFGLNGIFLVSYTIVGIIVGYLNTKYNKENRISLVYITIIATFIFEFIQYIVYALSFKIYSNMFYFFKQVVISSILNIVIVFIVYSLIHNLIEYFDSRLKRNLNGF